MRRVSLSPSLASLSALEDFFARCAFLTPTERARALLVATEYFENIVAYNKCKRPGPVEVTLRNARGVLLRIRYATCNFRELVRSSRAIAPHYDADARRYRGLGLRMCANLAKSVRYRKGLFKSDVIIIL